MNFLITVENTIKSNFQSYTIDFERALINATNIIFENKRQVGCFYHYCRNIRERALELGLYKKIDKDEVNNFLNEFYKMPFIFHDKNKMTLKKNIQKIIDYITIF